jgi:hypothetical protein
MAAECGKFGFCPKDVTKVVFLDIDGVLQHPGMQTRFDYIRDTEKLSKAYDDLYEHFEVDYRQYDKYDVMAVYADWPQIGVANLINILESTNAKIVLSSDWRIYRKPTVMYDFFRMHGLHKYYIDNTIEIKYDSREERDYINKLIPLPHGQYYDTRVLEILEYLYKYDHITHFVAIDDLDLEEGLNGHFVRTFPIIKGNNAEKAINILNNKLFERKFGLPKS